MELGPFKPFHLDRLTITVMICLPLLFSLPLQDQPPMGFGWNEHEGSIVSTSTAFSTGISQRDQFLGQSRCIVCGYNVYVALKHCHIIGAVEEEFWRGLKSRGWIPQQAKASPQHEPRNGICLCANHHLLFDKFCFFIRFSPETEKFILINYSNSCTLQEFHGRAIALDTKHHYSPYTSLFIIHEMRVRGFNPFATLEPDVPSGSPWTEWIKADGLYDGASGSFKRDGPPGGSSGCLTPRPLLSATANTDDTPSGKCTLAPLNADTIDAILAATRAMPTWKATVEEGTGTSWTGTADENTEKYIASIGMHHSS